MYYFIWAPEERMEWLRSNHYFVSPWTVGEKAGLLIEERHLQLLCEHFQLRLLQRRRTEQEGIFRPAFQAINAGAEVQAPPVTGLRQKAPRAVVPDGTAPREGFVLLCNARLAAQARDLQGFISGSRAAVEELRTRLATESANLRTAVERLDGINGGMGIDRERFGREFDALQANPKILEIQIDGRALRVFTRELYCQDPRNNKWHEIGKFRIEIPTTGHGTPRWINESRQVNGMNAPHVNDDGRACLGNAAETFIRMIRDFEYEAAVLYAIQFIESVNANDAWGRHISEWPVVSRKQALGE